MWRIAEGGLKVLFPIHPRTKKALEKADLRAMLDMAGIIASEPVSYVEMIALESEARLLLTASGGVQKEAYFFQVPSVVAREETEWTELVQLGWNRLAGPKTEAILTAVAVVLREDFATKPRPDCYGAGHAAAGIVNVLDWFLHR